MKDIDGDFVGIEIDETHCGMVTVKVGGRDFAQFQNARLADIDIEKVITWVNATAFDGSYMSDAYISPDLMLSEFAKYSFPDSDFDTDSHFAITDRNIY